MARRGDPELTRLAHTVIQPGFEGTSPPDWLRRRIDEGLASVVLFGRNIAGPEQIAALTAELRAQQPELIVAIDEEAGDVTRVEAHTGSSRPGNLALGAVDDTGLTEQVARGLGRELNALGITLDYAPSADVNSNPLNPVIGVRSFGPDTALVARHTGAWVRGLQSAGVAACPKHFPGHGDTTVDSHHGTPRVDAGPEELARVALPPFAAALDAGARAVMTAHLLVPAYDPHAPATLSPHLVGTLLRERLGFTGMVVTDAVEMRALTDRYGIRGATVRAVAAGCDAVCVGGESVGEAVVDQLTEAVVRAVLDGALPEERLAEAAARVREFAAWSARRAREAAASPGDGPSPAEEGAGLVAARRALRVDGREGGARLPLTGAPHVVELHAATHLAIDDATPWGLAAPLRALRADTTAARLTRAEADGDDPPVREWLRPAEGRELVVVVRDAGRHGWMARALAALLRHRPDAVVVEMGVPTDDRPGAVHLATHGATRVSGVAAAELLTGQAPPEQRRATGEPATARQR
ncbi:glycoside hydrolase family 3 protein [Streptomyces sp. NRRL F-5053]|uniref:glycoside hydrolase family 3 protein n=1 Tax=Streptomyces sp. NRRL F-5053 TaxID=1463854 RepID=UPI00068DAFD6|nr:glycoside hydrolase family 3 N-terminal domain-containing protein [Streptomyces sp. NRRL F-5053]